MVRAQHVSYLKRQATMYRPSSLSPSALTDEARDLAAGNLALAVSLAGKFRSRAEERGIPFDDLVSEAFVGVVLAARSYNPERGAITTITYLAVTHRLANFVRRWKRFRQVPLAGDGDEDVLALVPDRATPDPHLGQELHAWMSVLTPREVTVVERVFGLGGGEAMTLQEVGRELGFSGKWVGQLLERALSRLRQAAAQRGLDQLEDVIRAAG
jgi:RNA polymerase sigma factor (sigma-70 family)